MTDTITEAPIVAKLDDDELSVDDMHTVAEMEKFQAETALSELHYRRDRLSLRSTKIAVEQTRRNHEFHLAADIENRVYHFNDVFTDESTHACYEYLSRWARLDISEPVEIQMTSPGGDVWQGMALFDQILTLRQQGLWVRISVRGTAASMAAILVQAADERVMGPSSFMLVHKPSTILGGTLDQIEDQKIWLDLIQERVVDIFCERTGQTKTKVRGWFNRKDTSFSPATALASGLIDSIG